MGMTQNGTPAIRSIRLRFRSTPDATLETGVSDALALLTPHPDFRLDGQTLYIDYAFPALTAVEIWGALQQGAAPAQLTTTSRLRCQLRAFMEENERDRMSLPHGWQHHVREVYAHYFERRRGKGGDARRQQWRKLDKGTGASP